MEVGPEKSEGKGPSDLGGFILPKVVVSPSYSSRYISPPYYIVFYSPSSWGNLPCIFSGIRMAFPKGDSNPGKTHAPMCWFIIASRLITRLKSQYSSGGDVGSMTHEDMYFTLN